jgi:uncharacterized membrane-anchored protein
LDAFRPLAQEWKIMSRKPKKNKHEEQLQKVELEQKRLDLKRSKQTMQFDLEANNRSNAAEKRAVAKELRELEDQQIKRSADLREEINTWLKYLALVTTGGLSAIKFGMVTPVVTNIILSVLVLFWVGTAGALITRVVRKSRKDLKGKQ